MSQRHTARYPIHPDDWHLIVCQVIPGSDILCEYCRYLRSRIGQSYYWSPVAAAGGRLAQYLAGNSCTIWHMLVADDYLLECGGRYYRRGLVLFFVLCASLGVPLAWHKTAGGDTLIWVGFELLLRSGSIGISERRAEWFARWTEKIASSATVHMASFEKRLGRIMFVAGALEHERPFLGPLYKFLLCIPGTRCGGYHCPGI